MQLPTVIDRRRPRVDRREAAKILQCSRDNVRRMDKAGQFKSSRQDRNGTFTYDRREIEELARQRGLNVKPGGELAARIFAMFKARKRFEDIVIETEQEPDVVRALWQQYRAGFEQTTAESQETAEERAQREHDEQMKAMDRELERRRRGVLFGEERPHRASAPYAPRQEHDVATAAREGIAHRARGAT